MLEVVAETPRTKSIMLEVPDWRGHRAGQHVDVRLTAEDGYQAERSYSIGSAPEDPELVLTVERLDDGEVSPYLTDVLMPGDQLELRGPIGGYFVWEESLGGPLQLIAGGSGVVPFRAILRHWAGGSRRPVCGLLYSARSIPEVIYRDELMKLAADDGVNLGLALTREWPDDWEGHRGRIDQEVLRAAVPPPEQDPRIYICGPTAFVEGIAQTLVAMGYKPLRIRTERFGPTGT